MTGAPRPEDLLVSVVVPTWREADEIVPLLDHLASLPGRWEVVVVDGGSDDGTARRAASHPSRPRVRVREGGGRAAQCNDGLEVVTGDVVVLVHADSRLPADAHAQIGAALARDPRCPGGNFTLRFDGVGRYARFLGRFVAWQRRRGFYYGDSSIWLTRAALDALGGLREIPIMDDYDLARRLERLGPATVCLPGPATTSARRWERAGLARTLVAWGVIRWLYVAGVAPERLARLYRAVR